jgi:hypothetical protein
VERLGLFLPMSPEWSIQTIHFKSLNTGTGFAISVVVEIQASVSMGALGGNTK